MRTFARVVITVVIPTAAYFAVPVFFPEWSDDYRRAVFVLSGAISMLLQQTLGGDPDESGFVQAMREAEPSASSTNQVETERANGDDRQ